MVRRESLCGSSEKRQGILLFYALSGSTPGLNNEAYLLFMAAIDPQTRSNNPKVTCGCFKARPELVLFPGIYYQLRRRAIWLARLS